MRAFARSSSIACAIAASRLYFKNECEWQEEVKNKPRRVDDILSLRFVSSKSKRQYIFELFILK